MLHDNGNDQLAVIHVEGMHCHSCEAKLKKAVGAQPGVFEVEVDFNSEQVSVLFNRSITQIKQLIDAISQAGYATLGYTQSKRLGSSTPEKND